VDPANVANIPIECFGSMDKAALQNVLKSGTKLPDGLKWENFNKALECKPKSLSRINKLLNDPGVFDE